MQYIYEIKIITYISIVLKTCRHNFRNNNFLICKTRKIVNYLINLMSKICLFFKRLHIILYFNCFEKIDLNQNFFSLKFFSSKYSILTIYRLIFSMIYL